MPSWMQNLDSPPIHFAVGMLCSGVLWVFVLLFWPRLWIYWPLVMTAGGIWAEGPDLPLLTKFYPSLRLGHWISGAAWSRALHEGWPNLFFFHGWIDRSGDGGAGWGWAITVAIYAGWIAILVAYIQLRSAAT